MAQLNSSAEIREQIAAMENKLSEFKARLKEAEQSEYKAALQNMIDRFDLTTTVNVSRAVNVLDAAKFNAKAVEPDRRPPVAEQKVKVEKPENPAPAKKKEPKPEAHSNVDVKPEPVKQEEVHEEMNPVVDTVDDDNLFDFGFDEEKDVQPEADDKQDVLEDDGSMWDIFKDETADEEVADVAPDDEFKFDFGQEEDSAEADTADAEEPDESFDDMFDFNVETESHGDNKFDVNEALAVTESDVQLDSYKQKPVVLRAETSLLQAIGVGYDEGWIDDSNVLDLFFKTEDEVQNYKEAGIILNQIASIAEEHDNGAFKKNIVDFNKFPYQVKCKAALLAKNDIAAIIA